MAKPHQELLTKAIAREADAHRELMAPGRAGAPDAFAEASELYRRSWEQAPPRSYGRLVGMLKSSVLAGSDEGTRRAARYAQSALAADDDAESSPTAAYAAALVALISGDDTTARERAEAMGEGGEAFERTARAIAALAERDRDGYTAAVGDIVRDFEKRSRHLTGVAIADTALMLETLAAPRGLAAGVRSAVLPA